MIAKINLVNRMVDMSVKLSALLEQTGEHTLVVIGNGFDIAHGIESSYTNFRDWLIISKNITIYALAN
jgi:hypothetical protein